MTARSRPSRAWSVAVLYSAVVLAMVLIPFSFSGPALDASAVWTAVTLGMCSVAYSVAVRVTELGRRALTRGYAPHLQTTWVLAAVVAVPLPLVPAVAVAAFIPEWCYQRRSENVYLHKKIYSFAAMAAAVEIGVVVSRAAGWAWPAAIVLADVVVLLLIFGVAIADASKFGEVLERARHVFAPRSLLVDTAAVAVAALVGASLLLPDGAACLGFLGVPLLACVEYTSAWIEHRARGIRDELTGLYTRAAWMALAGAFSDWPRTLIVVSLANDDAAQLRTAAGVVKSLLPKPNAHDDDRSTPPMPAALAGRVGNSIWVLYANLDPTMAPVVVAELRHALPVRGVTCAVELSVVLRATDLVTAVDEAEATAGRELRRVMRVVRSGS